MSQFGELITGFDHIPSSSMKHLVVVCVVMYVFIFYIIDHIEELRPIQDACIKTCHAPFCKRHLRQLRGSNYYLHVVDKTLDVSNCLITTWEISHFLFHVYLGYYYNIYISLGLGLTFEIYEHIHLKCGSFLDIFWNTLGYLVGFYLRNYR